MNIDAKIKSFIKIVHRDQPASHVREAHLVQYQLTSYIMLIAPRKKTWFISIETFDQSEHLFMIQTFNKLGTEGKFLVLMKGI